MGAKLITGRNSDYSLQSERKTILDRLEDNKTATGDILCIKCEASNLIDEVLPITASVGFGVKKVVKLSTYHCGLCKYQVIDDREAWLIREKLK